MIHVLLDNKRVGAETFTLGYITGSKRRGEDLEYQRPGYIYRISSAITLAVEEWYLPYRFVCLPVIIHQSAITIKLLRKRIIRFSNFNHAEILSNYPIERQLREIRMTCDWRNSSLLLKIILLSSRN